MTAIDCKWKENKHSAFQFKYKELQKTTKRSMKAKEAQWRSAEIIVAL